MTQEYDATGNVVPLTIVQAGPCTVTQVKTKETDGYQAVQVGFGTKKIINKPLRGHLKDLAQFRHLKEFEIDQDLKAERGQQISAETFSANEMVDVIGQSKGKGFQGVVKRHGFHGSPASHGHKDQLRMPGSIGAGGVQKVFKGMRMAGHMGNERVTTKNLQIFRIDAENNLIYIIGAVPGVRNSLVEIKGQGELKFLQPVVKQEEKVSEPVETVVASEQKEETTESAEQVTETTL